MLAACSSRAGAGACCACYSPHCRPPLPTRLTITPPSPHHTSPAFPRCQVYTIYSILFIVFVILIIVTAFITVALTYFQLAVEDHR